MRVIRLLMPCFVLVISNTVKSQDSISSKDIPQVPSQYFETVYKKADQLDQKLDEKSKKVLAKMQKEEAKLQSKLAKIDSLAANNLLKDAESKYKQLQSKLEGAK